MRSKRTIITTIGIFAGIAVLLSAFVVYPIFQGILQDNETVLRQKQELLQIQESKKRFHEFESISQDYASEFVRLQALFVDRETPLPFFRFLDETALGLGIRMEKSPGNVQEITQDPWPSFEVRLVGEGSYPNVAAFVEKIENAPYLVEIQTFGITESGQSQESPAPGSVEFSLSAKVFIR
ncbi:MAG TPA: hypothetical protein VGA53_05040 [Candidatus Paceibacterota bacterium]